MQSTSITPTLRFNFIGEGERNTLLSRLTEGQTLQARVVEDLSDGRWAIRFLGHTLVAESRLNLAKGQLVEARVQDLGPPLVLSIAGRPGSEGEAVTNALQRFGLPADTTHRAILTALIREGVAITRGSVLELAATLQQLADQGFDGIQLDDLVGRILLLRSKGVPVTPDALAAFYGSAPSAVLGGLIAQLGDLLKAEARRLKIDSALVDAIERLRSDLPNARNLDGPNLQRWIARMGFDIERQMTGGIETNQTDLRDTLRALLGRLGALDEQSDAGNTIERALKLLDTLRLDALPGRDGSDLRLQVPLVFGNESTTVDLHLSRQGGNAQATVDPTHYTLTLRVTLSRLGEVQATLTRHESRTTCHLTVADPERAAWLEKACAELVEGLEQSGVEVGSIAVRSRPSRSEEPARVGIDLKI